MKKIIPHRLVKPSTRSFFREGKRLAGYSFGDWLHGYVYARWTYLYIGVATGEHPLTRVLKPAWEILSRLFPFASKGRRNARPVTFADTYHGKVVPPEHARLLVTLNQPIDLRNLEQVIPYARARDIVLLNPDHIAVLECPCRAGRSHPCLPLDVCLIIGEPFAGFIIEHHPGRARWVTPEEAADILHAEHERGHVHHAFFKDAMLGRFYAICNCCSCCCGAMQAMSNGIPMLAPSGYVVSVDRSKCRGCGACVGLCPFKALRMEGGKLIVDEMKCMGCGVCVSKCERDAPALVRDERKGVPLDIRDLM
ncbi:MAG: 4Fe-4S binding protein, partial [Candidatus Aminicenantales bacterium]